MPQKNMEVLAKSQELEKKINLISGKCTLCKTNTQIKCTRCGDYYCSIKCQEIDWPNHRYICFPMPTLISADVLVNKDNKNCENNIPELSGCTPKVAVAQVKANVLPKHEHVESTIVKGNCNKLNYEQPPANSSLVVITAVCTPDTVYVRSLNGNSTYLNNISTVSEIGNTAKRLIIKPALGDVILTTFQEDLVYYRASVLENSDENNIKVDFIDFGNKEVKKFSDLREMPQELYAFKVYPIRVQLQGVVFDGSNDQYIMDYLKSYEDQALPLQIINIKKSERDIINCELFDISNNENINERIMKF